MLSSCYQANGTHTVARNVVQNGQHSVLHVPVPPTVFDYNTYYTVKRKTRKWWKVIFARCLDMTICNAWIIIKNIEGAAQLSQKEFE